MQFTSFVPNFLLFLADYKYLLLFLGIILEGPILMIASGFLVLSGFFSLLPTFLIIMAGDLLGDIAWYYVGYFFAEKFLNKFGKFLKITPEMFEKAKGLFRKHHEKILLFSKMTIGLGIALATLMAAGATRVSFKKYIMLNFLGEIFLVSTLLSIGYFFGQMYTYIGGAMKIYFIIGPITVITILFYNFRKYMKNVISD